MYLYITPLFGDEIFVPVSHQDAFDGLTSFKSTHKSHIFHIPSVTTIVS